MKTQQERTRRALMLLPLVIIPLLALAFHALGGGSTQPQAGKHQGINAGLPEASFKKEDPENKLGFYRAMDQDSSRQESLAFEPEKEVQEEKAREEAIRGRVEAINREISRPETPRRKPEPQVPVTGMKEDVDRLEALMQSMQENESQDPEMQQLSSILDKIRDIQEPGRAKEREPLAVEPEAGFAAIPALIASAQKVSQGSVITLRLSDSLRLNGILLPAGQLMYGSCQIRNQRVLLDIRTIRLENAIIPVDLSVYSLDGMPGIHAPEAIVREAAAGGAEDVLRGIDINLDPSLPAQVAGAGIGAAKTIFSKRLRRLRVKLEAGQPVLLRNNQRPGTRPEGKEKLN